jgi:hypothetical protein
MAAKRFYDAISWHLAVLSYQSVNQSISAIESLQKADAGQLRAFSRLQNAFSSLRIVEIVCFRSTGHPTISTSNLFFNSLAILLFKDRTLIRGAGEKTWQCLDTRKLLRDAQCLVLSSAV